MDFHSLRANAKALIAVSLLAPTLMFGQGKSQTSDKAPSQQVQQALIALDKQWGEAAAKQDTATSNKILSDSYMGIGDKGEMEDKQAQIAATNATTSNIKNATYTADEYKFDSLSPDVVVMMHRATVKGTQDGKEVTNSHRSLHVFQKQGGQWRVVANAQLPIKE